MVAGTGRAHCSLDQTLCTRLVKAHINTLDDEKYLVKSNQELVVNYECFLQAVYPATNRLNPSLLKKCLKDVFGDVEGANLCAQRLAAAFAWVHRKESAAITGRSCHQACAMSC